MDDGRMDKKDVEDPVPFSLGRGLERLVHALGALPMAVDVAGLVLIQCSELIGFVFFLLLFFTVNHLNTPHHRYLLYY